MTFDSLKTWQKITLVNAAAVIGAITSLFVVPSDTPVWQWATSSAVALVIVNVAFLRRWRRKAERGNVSRNSRTDTILVLLLPLYLLYVILSYYFYHR